MKEITAITLRLIMPRP